MKRFLSWLLVLVMLLSVLAGCGANETSDTFESESETAALPIDDEYTLEREDGCNQITFYWYAEGVDLVKYKRPVNAEDICSMNVPTARKLFLTFRRR